MVWTAQEQFMLELVNRARLDPAAEAARFGIALNQGLGAGTIDPSAKEVLAPDGLLQDAADDHSQWMLATDTFSHTGTGGSSPGARMSGAGYVFANGWSWGENVSWRGSTGSINLSTSIGQQHGDLFLSPGHRTNILGEGFRELGIGQEAGVFSGYNASMVTQDFAKSGPGVFLTGVAYSDRDHDAFYSIGEGVSGVGFRIGANSTATAAAGGYALKLAPAAGVSVTVTAAGGAASTVLVDLSAGNVKLDLVDGNLFRTSGNLTLVSGVASAELLGIADLTLTGNALANVLTGNRGHNFLAGNNGNDTLFGRQGNDEARGGDGADRLFGGLGADRVFGGTGFDRLWGEAGNDTLYGNQGNDELRGADGADRLFGGLHADTLYGGTGFDTLFGEAGNDTLYGNQGNDELRGADGNDALFGGLQADRVFGGNGNDRLFGEAGNDTLTGGAGADRFIFANGCGSDRVADFENGADLLSIAAGAADFAAVTVTAQGADTLVQFADVSILLAGVAASLVDADDFLFG